MNPLRAPLPGLTLLTLLSFAAGCGQSPAQQAAATRLAPLSATDIEVPPKELVESVKAALAAPPLSLPVEEQDRGTLVTGWKRYRGDWHIGRYWQERTRYRINVSPDFDDPAGRSRLTVVAETEQRAAEGQRWDREARVPRPQRAENVLQHILNHVRRPETPAAGAE